MVIRLALKNKSPKGNDTISIEAQLGDEHVGRSGALEDVWIASRAFQNGYRRTVAEQSQTTPIVYIHCATGDKPPEESK